MESGTDMDLDWTFDELKRQYNDNLSPINDNILQMFLNKLTKEKERIETEQLIARLMYKKNLEPDKEALCKKFRWLALYYYNRNIRDMFETVILTSIIREWPVQISFVDQGNKSSYIWDRAPLALPMKDRSISKDGATYVIRVLALVEEDIGTILKSASHLTEVLEIESNGKEFASGIFLNNEQSHIPPHIPSTFQRKLRANSAVDSLKCDFDHIPTLNGVTFEAINGKQKSDFIYGVSRNISFIIRNIFISSSLKRSTITHKYLLKTHISFTFFHQLSSFTIQTKNYNFDEKLDNHTSTVKSMHFEAASNMLTHWRYSFPMIWSIIYEYYNRRGQLSEAELSSGGSTLHWEHIKEMIQHFIGIESNFHVRNLSGSELSTISRIILAHKLSDINDHFIVKYKRKKEEWLLNELDSDERRNIVYRLIILDDNFEVQNGETFTQAMNRLFAGLELPPEFNVNIAEFERPILDLSVSPPKQTAFSLYAWLHGISEVINGNSLHLNPRKSVEIFNRNLITLRSFESAKRTIIELSDKVTSNVKMIMLRFDERNESTMKIHVLDPYVHAQRLGRFGRISMRSLKNISVPLNSMATAPYFLAAVNDGVVSKNKDSLLGLYALLKTGLYRNYDHIVQISEFGKQDFHVSAVAIKLCMSDGDARNESVYPYDIDPLQSGEMEIDAYSEAKEIRKPEDDGYLTAEKKFLGVSHAKPSAIINPTFVDVFSRNIENQLTSQAPPSIPNISLPNQLGGTQSTYNSKFSNKFTIEKILGVGGYGIVFESLSNSDGLRYAVKRISVEENAKMSTFREVSALTQLDHPGIVKYKDSWVESPSIRWQMGNDLDIMNRFPTSTMPTFHRCNQTATLVYIQMEMCLYSLADWLKHRDTEYRISSWFKQIVSAVAYIHEKGFMHRDLKPSNILFSNPNTLKICDLGVATQRMIQDGEELTGSYTIIGSPLYMAPEQQSGWRYTSKVDVFALGLILAELSVVMTEEERRVAFNNYRSGKPNEILQNQPRNARFVGLLTQVDPKKRPTCEEILRHFSFN